jgi:acyl-CoA-binding protein
MNKGYEYDHNNTSLLKLSASYAQGSDSEDDLNRDQTLDIWTENAGNDEPYLVFKTERWAIDDVDELVALLNDFKSRYDL